MSPMSWLRCVKKIDEEKSLYFDTSALIKEFVVETGSDLVDEVVNSAKAGNLQIVTSVRSINEAIAVIYRLAIRQDQKIKES